jgi:predicted RNase H-like nuclease (RuvC/YqgF family)
MPFSVDHPAPPFEKHFMIGDEGAIWELKGNSPVKLVDEATEAEVLEFRATWEDHYDHEDREFSSRLGVRNIYVFRLRHIESLTEKLAEYKEALDESTDEIKALEDRNRMLMQGITAAVKILVPEGAAHV